MPSSLPFLLLGFAIVNSFRGRAWLNKWVAYALMAVLMTAVAYAYRDAATWAYYLDIFLLACAGYCYGYLHCWGKYFPDYTDTIAHVCVPLVDKITTALVGPYTAATPPSRVLLWKTVAMSLRFMIFFSPLHIGVAVFHVYLGAPAGPMIWAVLETIALLTLIGPIYLASFELCTHVKPLTNYTIALAEPVAGLVLGLCATAILS